MVRQTSIAAYNQIKDEGLLGKLQMEVYATLFNKGPMTQIEMWSRFFKKQYRSHSVTPRFSELERFGVIRPIKERPCRVSGRIAMVWDVTANLPKKLTAEEKMTRKQRIEMLLRKNSRLERDVSDLQERNRKLLRRIKKLKRKLH